MAHNLRAKVPAEDMLLVCDMNEETMTRFVKEAQERRAQGGRTEMGARVEAVRTVREVAERAVSFVFFV